MLRSTRLSFQILLAVLGLGTCAAAGCSAQTTSSDLESPTKPLLDQGTSGNVNPPPSEDASAQKQTYRGNPLCHVDSTSCMPDDDGYQRSPYSSGAACATAPPSSGDAAPADFASRGCRIGRLPGSTIIAPQCFATAAPTGSDGATCDVGEDCAPGLDCIVGDKGTKSCRHYCCGGTCKGNLSNGSATFCDVQSLADVPQKAPVCMPLKRCNRLLAVGECSATESCTVVTEAGDTGCVAIGDKQVGQSCDESHCAAKLTCLGQPGSRKCFKLCKVSASDCPNAQSCITSAAFKDMDFGVCL